MIQLLFCKLLRMHVRPRWLNESMSLYWCCERCHERQPGRLAVRR